MSDLWYLEYESPPPRPSEHHVRFVIIADTHSTQPNIPDGDVLLHCGDLTDIGTDAAFEAQIGWLRSLPHRTKIIIAGNHDFAACAENGWYEGRGAQLHAQFGLPRSDTDRVAQLLASDDSFIYLNHQSHEFSVPVDGLAHKKWKVFGSPWTPVFGGWAWNYERGEQAKELYTSIPQDTDILLTHGPPHGIGNLDRITTGQSVGCEELTSKLRRGELRPRLHCFGHIHEARGVHSETWTPTSSTCFVNAAMVEYDVHDRSQIFGYRVKHKPIIVDLDSRTQLQRAEAHPVK